MFISPMLLERFKATELQENPIYINNEDLYCELKLDGIRLILSNMDGKIRLYTRHNNEVTNKFPELTILPIPKGTIIDGELIVTKEGKPCFESVMERFMSKKHSHSVQFGVFDILYHNHINVMNQPLYKRKELLNSIIPPNNYSIFAIPFLVGHARDYFLQVEKNDLEGIVLKDKYSKYQKDKRSSSWLKVINYQYETVYITKIRKKKFGAMLTFKNGNYAGIMEYMPPAAKKVLYRHVEENKSEKDKFITLKYPIPCKVKFRNLTSKGLLRIPSFESWEKEVVSI